MIITCSGLLKMVKSYSLTASVRKFQRPYSIFPEGGRREDTVCLRTTHRQRIVFLGDRPELVSPSGSWACLLKAPKSIKQLLDKVDHQAYFVLQRTPLHELKLPQEKDRQNALRIIAACIAERN